MKKHLPLFLTAVAGGVVAIWTATYLATKNLSPIKSSTQL